MEKETREEIALAVADGIRAALTDPKVHCRYEIAPDEHRQEHEALRRFMSFTARLENLKWGVFQKLAIAAVLFLFGLTLYGGMLKLKALATFAWFGR
jgi:hypothetical protein